MTYLADNAVGADHMYIVTVLTDMMTGADTKAMVSIRLMGEYGLGDKHVLADDHIELFQISAEDIFIVAERNDLGRITHITLWVDYSNTSPAWWV